MIPIQGRWISKLSILLAGVGSVLMFAWPLLISSESAAEADVAQVVFIVLMPVMLILVLVEIATGEIGSKQIALLGVLIALNAVIRLLGAGTAGIVSTRSAAKRSNFVAVSLRHRESGCYEEQAAAQHS